MRESLTTLDLGWTINNQTKKEEIYMLKYKVSEIYILSIRFHKIFLSVNANSYTTCAVKQNLLFAK
jgi:hypothetical protein